jgi:hypothetical protein
MNNKLDLFQLCSIAATIHAGACGHTAGVNRGLWALKEALDLITAAGSAIGITRLPEDLRSQVREILEKYGADPLTPDFDKVDPIPALQEILGTLEKGGIIEPGSQTTNIAKSKKMGNAKE